MPSLLFPLRPFLAKRRPYLLALLLLAEAGLAQAQSVKTDPTFNADVVAQRARDLASQPWQPGQTLLPDELKALNYDQYRDIRFKPEKALWRKEALPFELMFFHLGKFQTEAVQINEVDAKGRARHIAFHPEDYDYGQNSLATGKWGDLGHAGFRVHYALNNPAYKDELIVFLGASYFRAIGAGQHYGLSARGLAVDSVGGKGEEFPRFTEFWIERPAPTAKSLVIHALMDSPRTTGAYRFEVHPGRDSAVDVQAKIWRRAEVATLGIAPLTSMYFFGENQPRLGDFRPEVHDSDGLMVATGEGEWLWRPLINPAMPLTTSFAMKSLRGFGLMQRDRDFRSYEDVEARYDQRPGLWITPRGDWGPGRVELLQLPTPDETNDNAVAYWVPEQLPPLGEPLQIAYRMQWQGDAQQRPPAAWVTQTRTGGSYQTLGKDEYQYIVDFNGPALAGLAADAKVLAVASSNANGDILEQNAYRNPATRGWRLALRVKSRKSTQPVELRAFLKHDKDTVSETWTSIIPAR
ncbi:MAG: glucan biosynthesis protein G [Moraxellaceae bacterium]